MRARIPVPPTSRASAESPAVKRVSVSAVSFCAARSLALSWMAKSSAGASPRNRWRWRRSAPICACAASIGPRRPSRTVTKTVLRYATLNTRRRAVRMGMTIVLSSSEPSARTPLASSTPTISKGIPRRRSPRPGSEAAGSSPKSRSATRAPSTATRRASSSSSASKKRPARRRKRRTLGKARVAPRTVLTSAAPPPFTRSVPSTPGIASSTPSNSARAAASAGVRVVTKPRTSLRATRRFAGAGRTTRRLVPIASRLRLTSRCAPAPRAPVKRTAATPIAIPERARATRSRCAASARSAGRRARASLIAGPSPQSVGRRQAGGPPRRGDAGVKTAQGRGAEPQEDRLPGEDSPEGHPERHPLGQTQAGEEPQDAAAEGGHRGLEEELELDVPGPGAHRPAQTDLAHPGAHRGQHQARRHHAPHQQRDRRHQREEDEEHPLDLADHPLHLRGRDDREVVRLARSPGVALAQQGRQRARRRLHPRRVAHQELGAADRVDVHHPALEGRERDDDLGVAVHAVGVGAEPLEQADDAKADRADLDLRPQRVLGAKQVARHRRADQGDPRRAGHGRGVERLSLDDAPVPDPLKALGLAENSRRRGGAGGADRLAGEPLLRVPVLDLGELANDG